MSLIQMFCSLISRSFLAYISTLFLFFSLSGYAIDNQQEKPPLTASFYISGSLTDILSDVEETLELPIHLDKNVLSDAKKASSLQIKKVVLDMHGIPVRHLALCLARLTGLDLSVDEGLFILSPRSPGKDEKDVDLERLRSVGLEDNDVARVRKEQTDLLEKALADQPIRLPVAGKTLENFFILSESVQISQWKRTGHHLSFCFSPELVEKGIMQQKLKKNVEGKSLESLLKGALSQLNCTYRNELGYLYIEEAKGDGRNNIVPMVVEPKTDTAPIVGKEKDEEDPAPKKPQKVGGVNAVKAGLGNFLLIRRIDGTCMALKFTEHTRPSTNPKIIAKYGSKYICYVFTKGSKKPKKYEGEVYEPENGGTADNIFIDCDTFRIAWSLGDWVYFSEAMTSMAQSDKKKISDIDFNDDSLQWIPYVPQ